MLTHRTPVNPVPFAWNSFHFISESKMILYVYKREEWKKKINTDAEGEKVVETFWTNSNKDCIGEIKFR
jgi:hypothetical protein